MFASSKASSRAASTLVTDDGVDLKWLDGTAPPTTIAGTAFGVPWPQGSVDVTTSIALTSSDGKGVPVQSWPLAYWPDGSLKWTGHALPTTEGLSDNYHLAPGEPTEPSSPVDVNDANGKITVTTGSFTAVFNKSGSNLIDSLQLNGQTKGSGGHLVVHVQDAPDEPELTGDKPSVVALTGQIDTVKIEQDGPVRAVVKFTGKYQGDGHDAFLPFSVRFYVSAGATAVRMVHFFIYDGDQNKDFIKGLGLTFTTPLSDELYNRHVRFVTTDGGIWGEAVRGLSGLRRDATSAVLDPQFQGQAVPDISTWPTTVSSEVDMLPVWADFTLDQLSAARFTIAKRTDAGRKAIFLQNAGFGERAAGVGYVGGANGGGVVFAFRDFWQKAPTGLDVRGAGGDAATVTVWAYSPRAPAMDMRHYDVVAHGLDLTYEDVGDPDPNPSGVGRSYEITLQVEANTPSRADLASFASVHTKVPQVVAPPEFYASRNLFGGFWSLPSDNAPTIEKAKSDILDFYVAEVDQRQFYGFWDYGDVMHTYDQTRHTWRYDIGGYAWDNGELGTDLWLWISFLRTGRADVFRLAHALTRHLSEADFHHTGPFAGLGSRHHVTHWGDGAKEARVSDSTTKRPFYYLTADELLGDIMEYSLQADQTILTWEPLRKVLPLPPQAPSRVRIGPDWTALAGNWFTQWERTNDSKWRDRIELGMRDIGVLQYGFFTGNGGAVGFFPDTGHMIDEGGEGTGSYHLELVFGGGEFIVEALDLINVPEFETAFLNFCKLYNATDADQVAVYGKSFGGTAKTFPQYYARFQAYAGKRLNDDSIKQAAWDVINATTVGVWPPVTQVGGTDVVNPVNEIVDLNTNDSAQFSLAQYGVLAIAPDQAPTSFAGASAASVRDDATVMGLDSEQNGGLRGKESMVTGAASVVTATGKRTGLWRRILCLK